MKKKLIVYIHILIFGSLLYQTDCSPIKDLQAAKAQLEAGKKSIADGKQGVIDGYNEIKSSIDKMITAADGVGSQMTELDAQKSIISDVLNKKLPEFLGLAAAATAIYPPFAALMVSVPALEASLWDFPKTFGGINSTLSSIVDTLHSVVNTVTPANEKLNPNNNPPALTKFDIAAQKFDAAIKKIDDIVAKLQAIADEI